MTQLLLNAYNQNGNVGVYTSKSNVCFINCGILYEPNDGFSVLNRSNFTENDTCFP